jgi:hypothetical protein
MKAKASILVQLESTIVLVDITPSFSITSKYVGLIVRVEVIDVTKTTTMEE